MRWDKHTNDLIFWVLIILIPAYIYFGSKPGPERARQILEKWGFPFTADHFVRSAYIFNNKALELFLIAGMDPDAVSQSGKTALQQAALKNNAQAVKLLLDYGANPHLRNQQGHTALDIALARKNAGATKTLLSCINKPDIPEINLAFLKLTSAGDTQMVQAMLDGGVDPGKSAMVQNGRNTEIINVLAAKGGDINARDSHGRTALMMAADRPSATKNLIRKGAKLNLQDRNGRTALMFAAWWLNDKTVAELICRGADPYIRDNQGRTAVDYAKLKKSQLQPESRGGNRDLIVRAEKTIKLLQEAM